MARNGNSQTPETDRPVALKRGRPDDAGNDRSAFSRLGRFAVRRRVPIIIVWAVAFVVMGTFAKGLQDRLGQGGWDVPGSDSLQVQHQIQQRFGEQPATAIVADPQRRADRVRSRVPVARDRGVDVARPGRATRERRRVGEQPRPSSPPTATRRSWSRACRATRTTSWSPPGPWPWPPRETCPPASRSRPAACPRSTTASTTSPRPTSSARRRSPSRSRWRCWRSRSRRSSRPASRWSSPS